MNRTCVVTGATGFLGGFLTAGLLERGYRVIALVRPRDGRAPGERTAALMRFFGLEPGARLETVAADIAEPGLGMPERVLDSVRDRAAVVLNCAADTSFAARASDRARRVNVDGVRNLFAAFRGRGRFHHVSTAYVAGRSEGLCPEKPAEPAGFHNPYERSKHEAERVISGLCGAAETRLTIYRPAVVYGDSTTGKSLGFAALYYPARVLLLIRDLLLRDIRERDGARARKLGAGLEPDGRMRLPVTVADTGGTVNLLPIDRLVRAVMTLLEKDVCGIFHILGSGRDTLAGLVSMFEEALPVTGLSTAPGPLAGPRSPLETMVDGYLEAYYPYFCDKRVFDDSQAARHLGPARESCPPLDASVLKRCIDFAREVDFGDRLSI